MKFRIEFDCDSAAFGDAPAIETSLILNKIALRLEQNYMLGPVLDSNGNTVGQWGFYTMNHGREDHYTNTPEDAAQFERNRSTADPNSRPGMAEDIPTQREVESDER
jgi:hypothetical protein